MFPPGSRSRETKGRLGGGKKRQKQPEEWYPSALVFRPDPDSSTHR